MLYLYAPQDAEQLAPLLRQALPNIDLAVWPQQVDDTAVRYAVVWNPPEGFFTRFSRLEAVFALGAGVDRLLARADLPATLPVIRLTDAGMAQQMAEYALYGVLRYQRQFDVYQRQQAERRWQPQPPRLAHEIRVSVLGLGAIGAVVATTLAGLGYTVSGWSRSPRELPGVACRHGSAALDTLLAETDVLVGVLPSTPETRGLLDRDRLVRLPHGAALINAGRGDQLDQAALLDLLDAGQLRFAQLDVFASEPLAAEHPLWVHPSVTVTPHIAAITLPGPAAQQIAANLRALRSGTAPEGLVDRRRTY
ncbi:2-hydroxyacid dehydrogenase [Pseudogulbenkiania subflava]|uniref:Glyoxylate/hydroxypyruvate reductase A n=1 Tax=Pseudogulbenkiania subflava DSM 22618 TaxID=1123014 RepID=A0A1Y6BKM4_9NEIS|nr:glyoxylate/hydroxypyruvate reductase A [Pseudogulbenkiania subflava]SMF07585.1 glyoxylate/hydroxypyruvate reductase A [Pseudogulbenkiania subflava DSM 22618]